MGPVPKFQEFKERMCCAMKHTKYGALIGMRLSCLILFGAVSGCVYFTPRDGELYASTRAADDGRATASQLLFFPFQPLGGAIPSVLLYYVERYTVIPAWDTILTPVDFAIRPFNESGNQ